MKQKSKKYESIIDNVDLSDKGASEIPNLICNHESNGNGGFGFSDGVVMEAGGVDPIRSGGGAHQMHSRGDQGQFYDRGEVPNRQAS